MPLNDDIQTIMVQYLKKFKRVQPIIHNVGEGLQIRTQAANQTTPEGRAKFLGKETVWLSIKYPQQAPINLARLSELKSKKLDFEVLMLDQYEALVSKYLAELIKIAAP